MDFTNTIESYDDEITEEGNACISLSLHTEQEIQLLKRLLSHVFIHQTDNKEPSFFAKDNMLHALIPDNIYRSAPDYEEYLPHAIICEDRMITEIMLILRKEDVQITMILTDSNLDSVNFTTQLRGYEEMSALDEICRNCETLQKTADNIRKRRLYKIYKGYMLQKHADHLKSMYEINEKIQQIITFEEYFADNTTDGIIADDSSIYHNFNDFCKTELFYFRTAEKADRYFKLSKHYQNDTDRMTLKTILTLIKNHIDDFDALMCLEQNKHEIFSRKYILLEEILYLIGEIRCMES